jgi:uncharacterized protein (UPF0303 family)
VQEGELSVESDLKLVVEQEGALVFERFDEDLAFALGGAIRDAAKALSKGGIATGVYLWDRTLFYGATAGATDGNRGWIKRKVKLVRLMLKSTYRIVLERGDKPRLFEPSWGIEPSQYAIAGGAFPITVKGIGVVGAAAASGLHERDDHRVVVEAICDHLGLDKKAFTLPPL